MTGAAQQSVTEQLLAVVGDHSPVPTAWTKLAGQAFADTAAVLVAGSSDPAVEAVVATVEESTGTSRSIATGASMPARSASLVDGTSAHALDYDDVDDSVIAHLSAVLVPALLSAGVGPDVSGAALVESYRCGVVVDRKLAAELGIRNHYDAGWHSSSTIGTIGAAAAVSRLWRLPADRSRHALGIAASLAAGTRQNFGSMTKPLHAGLAASNGVFAAQLARSGLTSDSDALGGTLGFVALHRGDDVDADTLSAPTNAAALNVKRFPCCYYTHSAIEAALEVFARGQDAGRIDSVSIAVQPGCLAPLVHPRPNDGSQAKFSMPYVIAAALLDGHIDLDSFTDGSVRRTGVKQLMTKVSVRESESPPLGAPATGGPFAVVSVRYRDGSCIARRVDRPAGHASRPLTDDQLFDKFVDCTSSADPGSARQTYLALRDLANQPSTRQLVDRLCLLSSPRSKELT
nr:MmgE/PrpD family protein [Rhodococcus sp. (in: high G+C Gram-positive bacteria)]